MDSEEGLTVAVRELNQTVGQLTKLMSDDYPKRTEVERRFISKLDNRKHATRMILVALFTVVGCYAVSTGAYAACFTGQESPGVCKIVPGYQERIERRDQINENQRLTEMRLEIIERELRKQK